MNRKGTDRVAEDRTPRKSPSGVANPDDDPIVSHPARASTPILASSQHAALLRRGWSLLLMEAAERAGLTPLPADEIHALAFLADCLAPVYGIPAMDGILLRRASGPLFPDLQWDLDRLWAMGFLELTCIDQRTEAGVVRRTGYATTEGGSARATVLQSSPLLDRLFTFFVALTTAVGRLSATARLDTMSRDLTYTAETVGRLIRYGDWVDGNPSIATADAFAHAGPVRGMTVHPWERLALYLAFLRHRLVVEGTRA